MSPAGPVFDTLTGPRAKELALRLETGWGVVRRDAQAAAGDRERRRTWRIWTRASRSLVSVFRSWLRYRRRRRHERELPEPQVSRSEIDPGRFEAFYRNWVLVPLRENFLRVLEDRGLTRRSFCARLGMSEAYLSQILNGRRNPSLRKVAEISYALQVDLGRIFAVSARRGGDAPWAEGATPRARRHRVMVSGQGLASLCRAGSALSAVVLSRPRSSRREDPGAVVLDRGSGFGRTGVRASAMPFTTRRTW